MYDALNVLIALRVITKDHKEIKWMGLSNFQYEKIKLEVSICALQCWQVTNNRGGLFLCDSCHVYFKGNSQRTHDQG